MQNDKKYLPSIYEIVVSNYLDDCNYSILVLSHEPLTKENANIRALANLNDNNNNNNYDHYYYVSNVKEPKLYTNEWTEEEHKEFLNIKSLINNK
jgi:hypothetical protein